MRREFVLSEAQAMAPLVRGILRDLTAAHDAIREYRHRVDLLSTCRASTDFRVRSQYYEAADALRKTEARFREFETELDDLGVQLLDPECGLAAFPFLWAAKPNARSVRRALFLFKPWEDGDGALASWRFVDDERERRVPSHWLFEYASVTEADEEVSERPSS